MSDLADAPRFPCAFCDFEPTEHRKLIVHLNQEHQKRQSDKALPFGVALPIQGRPERAHLYEWVADEEAYVAAKFDDQRQGHDESLSRENLEGFWERQVTQYYDRAKLFLRQAQFAEDEADRRHLEQRAQQAMAKAMMTAKGLVECSIRVYGPLPAPGLNSGVVMAWPNRR